MKPSVRSLLFTIPGTLLAASRSTSRIVTSLPLTNDATAAVLIVGVGSDCNNFPLIPLLLPNDTRSSIPGTSYKRVPGVQRQAG